MPGLVIALSFTYVTEHLLQGSFYQTTPLLVVVYAIMFFPSPWSLCVPPWRGRRWGSKRWPARSA